MMTALIIIGIIVLIIVFLVMCSIRAELKFYGGKLDFKVKYLFFTIYPFKEKTEKKKKKTDRSEQRVKNIEVESDVKKAEDYAGDTVDEISDDILMGKTNKAVKKINNIKTKIEQAKILWEFTKDPLLKLFRHIWINDLVVDFVAGGKDAFEAAMNYGKLNAVTYNVISLIRIWFPISVQTVDIACDFNSKESKFDGEFSVNLRLGTLISVAVVWLLEFMKHRNELSGQTDKNDVSEPVRS